MRINSAVVDPWGTFKGHDFVKQSAARRIVVQYARAAREALRLQGPRGYREAIQEYCYIFQLHGNQMGLDFASALDAFKDLEIRGHI